jgi:hypothetical protein
MSKLLSGLVAPTVLASQPSRALGRAPLPRDSTARVAIEAKSR